RLLHHLECLSHPSSSALLQSFSAHCLVRQFHCHHRAISSGEAVTFWNPITIFIRASRLDRDYFSIGIYAGEDPFHLRPDPQIPKQPILSSQDIHDIRAGFLADPFLIREKDEWLLFFEVIDRAARPGGKGCIALARSPDGLTWRYDSL